MDMSFAQRAGSSEVGPFPEEWDLVQLGELSEFVTSGSRGWARHYSSHGALFIRSQNIRAGRLDFEDSQFVIPPQGAEGDRTRVKHDDLLITVTGNSVGNVAYVNGDLGEAYISQHVGLVRLSEPRVADFICRFLSPGSPGNQQIWARQSGQSKPGLTLLDLRELWVALPRTKTEQRAIAAALSDVDELIGALDKLIAKKRAIKLASMQQLLTGKTRLPGFESFQDRKLTDVGQIPEDWGVVRLHECLKRLPSYGINAAATTFDDSLPTYLRITDINDNGRFSPSPKVSVQHPNASHYLLEDGDLVFARTGASVGKSYRYRLDDGPLVFAGFLIRVTPHSDVLDPVFLSNYAQSKNYWDWVNTVSARSGQPGINGQEYGQFLLPLPSVAEQLAIGEVVSDMDLEISALEQRRDKVKAIKQGMMQALLTGRVRLIEPEDAA